MKLIINTAHQRFGGGVQVALSFIYECCNFKEHEYHVFVGPGLQESINENELPGNFNFYKFAFGVINLRKVYKINRTLREYEKRIKPDCIITTTGPSYFHSEAPQIIGFNLPLYIYNESPYVISLNLYGKLRLYLKKKLHFYFFKRDANAFLVQTDDINERVRDAFTTDRVYTVTNNHNGYYLNWNSYPNKLPDRNDNRIRLLTLSSYYRHKNLELIPKVADELENRGYSNIDFVLTIQESAYINKINVGKGGKNRVINIGPVKPEECPSLYEECDMMFLPTLAESFSASYPEAMIMEKPIITTDLGFAKSICGDAALYFEPKNALSAADKIERLLKDKTLKGKLVKIGKEQLNEFDSPDQRANKYLKLCKSIS